LIVTKSRHQRSLSHLRATHEATNRERLLEAKSLIKTALHQRLDDLRSDYEHRLETSKAKLDAKYANQDPV
jgi:phage-related minor tail protein